MKPERLLPDPIVEAQRLRARGSALRRQLLELNATCVSNYAIALALIDQIIAKRKTLAKRYPWLVATL